MGALSENPEPMKGKIFVSLSTFAEYGDGPLRLLEESGFPYSLNPLGRRLTRDDLIEMGRDCEGVIAGIEPYDTYIFDNMPELRCISRCGVGIDNIDLVKAKECGVTVLNTPDVVIQPVVELTTAMIFDLMRKLSYHSGLMHGRTWRKTAGNLLVGKTVGILGLGRIGKRVAEVMLSLGTKVYGTDISPDLRWAEALDVKIVPLGELLRVSDILTLHLSTAKGTKLQLGESELRSMKKGAVIVNTARGQYISETALCNVLKDGHLEGAALDVFQEEPYTGKLCELENVILTPHVATLTRESRVQMELQATRNLLAFLGS
jgi:D-3-phosphoglycerate dehydrogenase